MSSSSAGQIAGYAQAMLSVARAEGNVDATRSQLSEVAQAVAGNEELSSALSNNLVPAGTRMQIVEDVLGGRVSDTVRALVAMVVGAGRGSDLSAIVHAFAEQAASSSGKRLATVRTAVPLSDEQKIRLAQALRSKVGSDVELENIVDPNVVGGAVTTIGDTVIDGSVRTRLSQMAEAL